MIGKRLPRHYVPRNDVADIIHKQVHHVITKSETTW